MAISLIRASISQSQSVSLSHPLIHSLRSTLSNIDESSRRKRLLSCAPSELNPARSEVSFCVGTHLIPHPNKVERGGEDAFFVSNYSGGVIAVADGVSGWAEQNVDPSLFPKEFMANASNLVGDEEVVLFTSRLIRIVAILERNGSLKIASVGDCGLRVMREGQIIFSTSPQEHYFDCPYQLSSEVVGQTYLDAMGFDVPLWKKILGMKLTGGKLDDITVIVGLVVSL
ncbi:probable protein phosphatase 2C 26 isoform X1 [Fagus crenata]